jgi:predicted acylesterase/phospholipase RssA
MNRNSILFLLFVAFAYTQPTHNSDEARVGLTLSAGGALGLAHIGVLKVLEREQIPISCISSNSMGSIIGGLYAAGYSAAQIESIAVNMDWEELLTPSILRTTRYLPKSQQSHKYVFRWSHDKFIPSVPSEIISLQQVEFVLMKLLSKIEYDTEYSFDSLEIPIRVIAVDLVSGHRVVMKEGRLDQAIRGSIAMPAVFAPQRGTESQVLVDGGVLQYFPVDPLSEFYPDVIIASLTMLRRSSTGRSITDVVNRLTNIRGFEDIEYQKSLADVVIEPNLSQFGAQDYARAEEIIQAGVEATESQLAEIRLALAGRKPVSNQKRIDERHVPYIRKIDFDGLGITRLATIRKRMRSHPGRPLNFDLLIDDMTELYETGLFKHVDYELRSLNEDTADILIKVEEEAYGFYLLGIRYDNANNATLGLEIGQGNVFGVGSSVRAILHLGDPNEYRVGITDAKPLILPLGYEVYLFWNSIDRSFYEAGTWEDDYNTDCRGGMAELCYAWTGQSCFRIGVKAHQAVYRFPESPFFDTLPPQEWVTGPAYAFELNTYNNPYFPVRGGRYNLDMFIALKKLGGRNDALKISASIDQLLPLTSWLIANFGMYLGTSAGQMPWAEYYHTGGADFTGFRQEEFSTAYKMKLNLGLDFPLFSIFGNNNPMIFQLLANVATFAPPDSIFFEWGDRSIEDFEVGVGSGIRTDTPIGPLRLTFGIGNLHRRPISDNIQYILFFSLGNDFCYTK